MDISKNIFTCLFILVSVIIWFTYTTGKLSYKRFYHTNNNINLISVRVFIQTIRDIKKHIDNINNDIYTNNNANCIYKINTGGQITRLGESIPLLNEKTDFCLERFNKFGSKGQWKEDLGNRIIELEGRVAFVETQNQDSQEHIHKLWSCVDNSVNHSLLERVRKLEIEVAADRSLRAVATAAAERPRRQASRSTRLSRGT